MSYREKSHWGKHLWAFIHTISIIDFEDNLRFNEDRAQILRTLQYCFPCHKCKDHYVEFLAKLESLDMTQSMVLFYWSVDLHNSINKKHNKPEWSYQEEIGRAHV